MRHVSTPLCSGKGGMGKGWAKEGGAYRLPGLVAFRRWACRTSPPLVRGSQAGQAVGFFWLSSPSAASWRHASRAAAASASLADEPTSCTLPVSWCLLASSGWASSCARRLGG